LFADSTIKSFTTFNSELLKFLFVILSFLFKSTESTKVFTFVGTLKTGSTSNSIKAAAEDFFLFFFSGALIIFGTGLL
jgi:hypothetical protein